MQILLVATDPAVAWACREASGHIDNYRVQTAGCNLPYKPPANYLAAGPWVERMLGPLREAVPGAEVILVEAPTVEWWRGLWHRLEARGDYLGSQRVWERFAARGGQANRFSILVPALESRRGLARDLLESLQEQADQAGGVEVLVDEDDGSEPTGAKRNRLLQKAMGDYLAFVDDDDWVAPTYVDEILAAAAGKPDVVTFQKLVVRPGGPSTLRVMSFRPRPPGGRRGVTSRPPMHVCAWRRELAQSICFVPILRYDEDAAWYRPLGESLKEPREEHVSKILYVYRFSPMGTAQQRAEHMAATWAWAAGGVRYFLRNKQIHIATSAGPQEGELIEAWNPRGEVEVVARDGMEPFFIYGG